MSTLAELIHQANEGAPGARDNLFAAAYPELRKLARSRLRDGGRNTCLDTTALVHETYLRFIDCGGLRSDDRKAFFCYASQIMRSVIVDVVRSRLAQRRGGDLQRLTLDTAAFSAPAEEEQDLLHVHEALLELEMAEPRLAKVVEMRYFGGYSESDIAQCLDLNERTVRRDWDRARLLLKVALQR